MYVLIHDIKYTSEIAMPRAKRFEKYLSRLCLQEKRELLFLISGARSANFILVEIYGPVMRKGKRKERKKERKKGRETRKDTKTVTSHNGKGS